MKKIEEIKAAVLASPLLAYSFALGGIKVPSLRICQRILNCEEAKAKDERAKACNALNQISQSKAVALGRDAKFKSVRGFSSGSIVASIGESAIGAAIATAIAASAKDAAADVRAGKWPEKVMAWDSKGERKADYRMMRETLNALGVSVGRASKYAEVHACLIAQVNANKAHRRAAKAATPKVREAQGKAKVA